MTTISVCQRYDVVASTMQSVMMPICRIVCPCHVPCGRWFQQVQRVPWGFGCPNTTLLRGLRVHDVKCVTGQDWWGEVAHSSMLCGGGRGWSSSIWAEARVVSSSYFLLFGLVWSYVQALLASTMSLKAGSYACDPMSTVGYSGLLARGD